MIFSIFRFFCTLRFQIFKYCPNHTSMERLFMYTFINLNKKKMVPYDWFCAPGSHHSLNISRYLWMAQASCLNHTQTTRSIHENEQRLWRLAPSCICIISMHNSHLRRTSDPTQLTEPSSWGTTGDWRWKERPRPSAGEAWWSSEFHLETRWTLWTSLRRKIQRRRPAWRRQRWTSTASVIWTAHNWPTNAIITWQWA